MPDENRRIDNVVWTISEDYKGQSYRIFLDPEEESSNDHVLDWALLGFAQKQWGEGFKELSRYIENVAIRVLALEVFRSVWMLALEIALFPLLEQERPLLKKYRRELLYKKLSKLEKRRRLPLEEDIQKAYVQKTLGLVPKVHHLIAELVSAMDKASSVKDAKDMQDFLEGIFEKYFHLEKTSRGIKPISQKNPENNQNTVEFQEKYQYINSNDTTKTPPKERLMDRSEEALISSAEFNPNDTPKEEVAKKEAKKMSKGNKSDEDAMRKQVIKTYGRSIFLSGEQALQEVKICQGIHRYSKVHLTDGVLPEDAIDPWRKEYLLQQRQLNMQAYYLYEDIHKQHIQRLSGLIRQVLLRNLEEEKLISNQGELEGNRVWRGVYIGDSQVFSKRRRTDEGKIAVDILMDSSGSQRQQQEKVALQSFMIAQALSNCKIPCRVLGFNSFFDYTILRVFRDYKEESSKDAAIFDYWASGSNRDGLALRLTRSLMEKDQFEHRILIVLNDAKPNDVRPSKEALSAKTAFASYTGFEAIKDTARAVRDIRNRGIAVLGIYTGEEESSVEQQIYGKDFLRIHDVAYFSTVVGSYLQRQLEWMLNLG